MERLRADGHATVSVAELSPSITDDQVLDEANARSALLVTADKDFGELVYRLGRVHAAELVGAFCVIAPGSIRIRRPPAP